MSNFFPSPCEKAFLTPCLSVIHQPLLQSLTSHHHPEERAEVSFLKNQQPGAREGGSCAWSALEREGLGELRQHLLFQGLSVSQSLNWLCTHSSKPATAFSACKCKVLGDLRHIKPQQNHSSLVHLFMEWLLSSSINQELVLSTLCYNSTKHRQQLVTPDIPPASIQMNYWAHFKSYHFKLSRTTSFPNTMLKNVIIASKLRMWFPFMGE